MNNYSKPYDGAIAVVLTTLAYPLFPVVCLTAGALGGIREAVKDMIATDWNFRNSVTECKRDLSYWRARQRRAD